jgi:maltodextrin utilization protein YvdJ
MGKVERKGRFVFVQALEEMQEENEKLDLEREAAQRLLSEMEDAGAQKEAELSALAEENQSLSQVWHARDETDIIKFLVAVFSGRFLVGPFLVAVSLHDG